MPTLLFSGSVEADEDLDRKDAPAIYVSPYAKSFQPRGTGGKDRDGTTSRSKKLAAGKLTSKTVTTILPDKHEHDYFCIGGDCSRRGCCEGGEDRHLDTYYESRYDLGDEF